jgi:hypothetical protein
MNATDKQFVAAWKELGTPQKVAIALGMNVRSVYSRRNALVSKGIVLQTISDNPGTKTGPVINFERRRKI